MGIYQTAEVAAIIGIHPNTVRLYEEWGLIPKPARLANGYRVFTDFHIEQLRLARLAFQIEVVQNGLRKKIAQMVKTSAAGDFERAIALAEQYLAQVRQEHAHAEETIGIVRQILSGDSHGSHCYLKRKDVSEQLQITMDTLRNWEMNGLLTVKRRENGYRVYTEDDIRRLKIIRSLRCANYSLEAILRLLDQLAHNPQLDILATLNTPKADADIIAVCDRLTTSLSAAEDNAKRMIAMLYRMKKNFGEPSTLPPVF